MLLNALCEWISVHVEPITASRLLYPCLFFPCDWRLVACVGLKQDALQFIDSLTPQGLLLYSRDLVVCKSCAVRLVDGVPWLIFVFFVVVILYFLASDYLLYL